MFLERITEIFCVYKISSHSDPFWGAKGGYRLMNREILEDIIIVLII